MSSVFVKTFRSNCSIPSAPAVPASPVLDQRRGDPGDAAVPDSTRLSCGVGAKVARQLESLMARKPSPRLAPSSPREVEIDCFRTDESATLRLAPCPSGLPPNDRGQPRRASARHPTLAGVGRKGGNRLHRFQESKSENEETGIGRAPSRQGRRDSAQARRHAGQNLSKPIPQFSPRTTLAAMRKKTGKISEEAVSSPRRSWRKRRRRGACRASRQAKSRPPSIANAGLPAGVCERPCASRRGEILYP